MLQGRAATLLKLLTRKFGTLDTSLRQRIEKASEIELDAWTERVLFAASLDEVLKP